MQDLFPLVNDGLHLKSAAHLGGVFQHDTVGRRTGDQPGVQVLPLFAAEGQVINRVLGRFVHKIVQEKIAGVEVDDDPAQIEDDIFIHNGISLRAGIVLVLRPPVAETPAGTFLQNITLPLYTKIRPLSPAAGEQIAPCVIYCTRHCAGRSVPQSRER